MGQAKTRLARTQEAHPFCCFCGGTVATETIEHAPPKVFFLKKQRLKGLEFPACARCNNGSSQLDQVAAFVAISMAGILDYDNESPYWKKLATGVRNNTPEVVKYMGVPGSHHLLRVKGRLREVVRIKLDPRLLQDFIHPWAAKQMYALWYAHAGFALGKDARVFVRLYTNDKIIQSGVPDEVMKDLGLPQTLTQGKLEASGQYFYRIAIRADLNIAKIVLGLHDSSIIVGIIFPEEARDKFTSPFRAGELFRTSPDTGIVPV
ncbi:hypothetical protein ACFO5X_04000 [Seohaeicola nanhaiensis]|uniref:HNH endonuclease n=1 Tax=Seohaeicola nanhaiensis TaxID=1387282 RepID=A0ABV9KBW9_9RHOB